MTQLDELLAERQKIDDKIAELQLERRRVGEAIQSLLADTRTRVQRIRLIRIKAEKQKQEDYKNACYEHAFLLRCEGKSYDDIGRCFGLSARRAKQLAFMGGRKLNNSMMKTRTWVRLEHDLRN